MFSNLSDNPIDAHNLNSIEDIDLEDNSSIDTFLSQKMGFNIACNDQRYCPYGYDDCCCECCHDSVYDCEFSCKDLQFHLIESVAKIEVAISCILHAEGEKIQSALKIFSSIEDVLKINDSVKHTISEVAELEKLLLKKLEYAITLCARMDE